YATDRRFDAICVTAAVDVVPPRFLQWLRPGGRLFVVRGRSPVMEAVLVHNDVNGPRIESLFETDLPYLAGAAPTPEFVF
ncbi:MAG: protein-L-isoaspartate O-methyltransferase, partial [Pseudoxanthomonas sp.]